MAVKSFGAVYDGDSSLMVQALIAPMVLVVAS